MCCRCPAVQHNHQNLDAGQCSRLFFSSLCWSAVAILQVTSLGHLLCCWFSVVPCGSRFCWSCFAAGLRCLLLWQLLQRGCCTQPAGGCSSSCWQQIITRPGQRSSVQPALLCCSVALGYAVLCSFCFQRGFAGAGSHGTAAPPGCLTEAV